MSGALLSNVFLDAAALGGMLLLPLRMPARVPIDPAAAYPILEANDAAYARRWAFGNVLLAMYWLIAVNAWLGLARGGQVADGHATASPVGAFFVAGVIGIVRSQARGAGAASTGGPSPTLTSKPGWLGCLVPARARI